MADGFEICRAFGGALAGFQPIADGTFDQSSFREMVRQEFRLTRNPLGKAPLHDFGDARVQLLPIAAQKRAVSSVLHQSVLKGVNGLWWRPALERQFSSYEPSQIVL